MPRHRVVGWLECVARSHPPAFQRHRSQILVVGIPFPVAGIFICLLEIGYPFFIWQSKTRKIWLIGICAMHVGIGLTMGMYLYPFIMIILNVAAFGPGFAQRTKRCSLQPQRAAS